MLLTLLEKSRIKQTGKNLYDCLAYSKSIGDDNCNEKTGTLCINMSGHTLMGRPAARLETMVLVRISYVVVCIVDKRR